MITDYNYIVDNILLISDLADNIYNDLAPWEKDDCKKREILETLTQDPLQVVKYLVERFIGEV